MDYKIIADSCCDITEELRQELQVTTVPLILRLGEREFIDDTTLDLPAFMQEMQSCSEKVGSAAPAPYAYQKAFEEAAHAFGITLSSQLSGSYASAATGAAIAKEHTGADTHVFDSKSASAGELLIAFKIRELIQNNLSKDAIIGRVNHFIDEMKTYFVLERYDNLQKNGRLGKVAGKLINILGIRLIMGADGNGNISLFHKARGEKQVLQKMLSLISESNRNIKNGMMVITHCNNLHFAERLSSAVKEMFDFKKVYIVPTGGLSSLYADNKGVIMAF